MSAPATAPASNASLELVRDHQRAWIARLLHDEVGPALSGMGLRLAAWDGEADEKLELQSALGTVIETVRVLQYLAQSRIAYRFGIRRAFELLPYCAAPGSQARVTVIIEEVPELDGPAAQEMYEAAAGEVARASIEPGAAPLRVTLTGQRWTLSASGD